MRFEDVFSTRAAALRITQDSSNAIPFAGAAFFPTVKQAGLDLKLIKAHKGLGVVLKPAAFDTLATIRSRQGFTVSNVEMPLFRESMRVGEKEMMEIQRAQQANDPYLLDVLGRIYDDTNTLVEGARIAQEKMRCSLLCPQSGNLTISLAADNAIYNYDYDNQGTWKANHYVALASNNDKWSDPVNSKPLDDIQTGVTYLRSIGYDPGYLMMNTTTFNYLVASDQIKNALITLTGSLISFMDVDTVREVIRRKTGLVPIIYDKMYTDLDGTDKKFFADNYCSILPRGGIGRTVLGTTPEERTALGDAGVDVSILESGIAIAHQTTYGPPVQESVTASMICLPSAENLDGMYVIKVA